MYPFITILNREIPTYGICMLCGIILVFLLALSKKDKYPILFEDLLIIGAFAVLFALPSGSIMYAIVTFGFKKTLISIFNVNFNVFGGLVFYGALLGGILGAFIGIKVAKVQIINAEKAIVPFLPIGHAIGRIGCVMAGCCYGMEYNGVFAVYYPHSVVGISPDCGHFPVQFLEAIFNIIITLCLIKLSDKLNRRFQILSTYLICYGIVRFFTEFLRGDKIRGIYFHFSTSQWISIVLIILGLLRFFVPFILKNFKKVHQDSID